LYKISCMKKVLLGLLVMMIFNSFLAQNLSDLSFGTDSTFEVLTWNIEWFPKNGQTTVNYVAQIIEELDVDVMAIQEVDDTTVFKQMIDDLEDYDYFFKSSYFAGLAYIYNNQSVVVDDIYEIYTSQPYWSPFPRSPVVMELSYLNEELIVINNHFKCCGDGVLNLSDSGDEESRRHIASTLLKQYIDTYFPNKRVFMLGDLNDILTDNQSNNVFQMYLDDPLNYAFADMNIAIGASNGWSYPSWPSHLDHILISNELFADFGNTNSVIEVIKVDDYMASWSAYDNNVSDHRPVGIKMAITPGMNRAGYADEESAFKIYPNPVSETLVFKCFIDNHSLTINIYDLQGNLIDVVGNVPSGHEIMYTVSDLAPGVYYAQFLANNNELVIKRFMVLR
jgi:endonuclease/exonuclease/phosphatase family metal-dependent hydrolase